MNKTKPKNLVQGVENNEHFSNCYISSFPTEGRLMAVNDKYLAITEIGTGAIKLVNSNFPINLSKSFNKFSIEKSNILDMEFSPFDRGILCFSTDNGNVFLSKIREKNENNIDIKSSCYGLHTKKVGFVNFNPIASNVMCSGTSYGEVHIWESNSLQTFSTIKTGNNLNNISWSPNGDLIGISTKNRLLNIYDPREGKRIFKSQISEISTNSRFAWIDNNSICVVGWKQNGDKILSILDIRNNIEAQFNNSVISSILIDKYSSLTIPYVDPELKLIYTVGKEETSIKIFDYADGELKKNNEFKSSELNSFTLFFNRQYLNKEKTELDRMARYTKNRNIYYVSFYNQSGQDFDGVLYPSEELKNPQMTYLEWLEGKKFETIPIIIYKKPLLKNKENNLMQNNIVNNEENIEEEEENPRKDSFNKLPVDGKKKNNNYYEQFIREKKSPNKFENNQNNQLPLDYKNLYYKLEEDYKNLSSEYKILQNQLANNEIIYKNQISAINKKNEIDKDKCKQEINRINNLLIESKKNEEKLNFSLKNSLNNNLKFQQKDKEYKDLERIYNIQNQSLKDMKEKEKKSSNNINNLKKQIKEKNLLLEEKEKEIAQKDNIIKNNQSNLDSLLNAEKKKFLNENLEMKEKYESTMNELNNVKKELEEMKNDKIKYDNNSKIKQDYENQNQILENNIKEINKKYESEKIMNQKLSQENAKYKENINKIKKEKNELQVKNNQLNNLKETLDIKESTILSLEDEIKRINHEKENLNNKYDEVNKKYEEEKLKMDKLKNEIKLKDDKNNKIFESENKIKSELKNQSQINEQLKNDLVNYKNEISKLKLENEQKEININKLKKDFDEASNKLEEDKKKKFRFIESDK